MLRTEYKRLKLSAVAGLSAYGILVVACLFLEPGWAASVDAAQVSAAGETSKDIYYQTEAVPVGPPAPSPRETIYPRYGTLDNRIIIWFVTQQHTYFGGFVLALPIFCLLIEVIGLMMRDREAASRYDRVARDFLQVSLLAFSMTAMAGAVMLGRQGLSEKRRVGCPSPTGFRPGHPPLLPRSPSTRRRARGGMRRTHERHAASGD